MQPFPYGDKIQFNSQFQEVYNKDLSDTMCSKTQPLLSTTHPTIAGQEVTLYTYVHTFYVLPSGKMHMHNAPNTTMERPPKSCYTISCDTQTWTGIDLCAVRHSHFYPFHILPVQVKRWHYIHTYILLLENAHVVQDLSLTLVKHACMSISFNAAATLSKTILVTVLRTRNWICTKQL